MRHYTRRGGYNPSPCERGLCFSLPPLASKTSVHPTFLSAARRCLCLLGPSQVGCDWNRLPRSDGMERRVPCSTFTPADDSVPPTGGRRRSTAQGKTQCQTV